MADLADLKQFGEEVAPLVKDLIDLWADDGNAARDHKQQADAAILKLLRLVEASSLPTSSEVEERIGAMISVRDGIREVIKKAATSAVMLTPGQFENLQDENNNLRDAIGRLGLISVFAPIPQLLTPQEANELQADIKEALNEIKAKKKAKAILDTVVDVLLIAARIAIKLGVA